MYYARIITFLHNTGGYMETLKLGQIINKVNRILNDNHDTATMRVKFAFGNLVPTTLEKPRAEMYLALGYVDSALNPNEKKLLPEKLAVDWLKELKNIKAPVWSTEVWVDNPGGISNTMVVDIVDSVHRSRRIISSGDIYIITAKLLPNSKKVK